MAIEPISAFYSAIGRYPGNNKQWWVAKTTADDSSSGIKIGDFQPTILDKLFSGNNRAPRGHFILNAYTKDRSAVSGIADLPSDSEATRPNTVCFYSGRAWYGSGSNVYYSRIIEHKYQVGLCHQEADPTSEDISDLIDSDGGQVTIPEAQSIVKIIPFTNGVFVFALNGVWFISGGDSKFSATNINVDKVSNFGTKYSGTIAQVDDTVYWWSEVGIQALQQSSGQFGPIPGKFGNTNIAEQTIQTFYNSIEDTCKVYAKVCYDTRNNLIQWIYSSDASAPRRYDSVLIYDVTLQAFYPWKISYESGFPQVIGIFLDIGSLSSTITEDVEDVLGANITANDASTVSISTTDSQVVNKPTNLTYTTKIGSNITFSKFENRNFADWQQFNTIGLPYNSFVETGYELNNDAMRKKEAVRVFVYFRRTDNDIEGTPSSCKMTTKWEWSGNVNSNRWSREVEVYRASRFLEDSDPNVKENFPVLVSNNKVRGNGKAVQFRFGTNEIGRNFDLLGWSVLYSGNTKP
jgi:hypothetical protein